MPHVAMMPTQRCRAVAPTSHIDVARRPAATPRPRGRAESPRWRRPRST